MGELNCLEKRMPTEEASVTSGLRWQEHSVQGLLHSQANVLREGGSATGRSTRGMLESRRYTQEPAQIPKREWVSLLLAYSGCQTSSSILRTASACMSALGLVHISIQGLGYSQ